LDKDDNILDLLSYSGKYANPDGTISEGILNKDYSINKELIMEISYNYWGCGEDMGHAYDFVQDVDSFTEDDFRAATDFTPVFEWLAQYAAQYAYLNRLKLENPELYSEPVAAAA
jgi:hypothetical protein